MQVNSIIWDWNGTLLNDLSLCLSSINSLLGKRALPLLNQSYYREVFSFPVRDYYKDIGFDFDKEDFEIPAREFIDLFEAGVSECMLHPSAIDVLDFFRIKGTRQYVLSATQHALLEATLQHNKIISYFESISGLDDHYASSKVERGLELFSQCNIDRKSACMIGDTIHDFEVAEALDINCVLIADGHQSKSRLLATGAPVVDNLSQLPDLPLFS